MFCIIVWHGQNKFLNWRYVKVCLDINPSIADYWLIVFVISSQYFRMERIVLTGIILKVDSLKTI